MDFFAQLVRFETALWNHLDRDLRAAGAVTMANVLALRILDQHGDRGRVLDLSEELGITIGAASKLTDRLERDGFAARRAHPQDRRSSLISLTSKGEAALREGTTVTDALVATLFPHANDRAGSEEALTRLEAALASSIAEGKN